ncbi:MAG: DUF1579 family protein [Phycisphaerales bacterium]|nr:DUF1579 family protein [Phycisphaerales bacterium]
MKRLFHIAGVVGAAMIGGLAIGSLSHPASSPSTPTIGEPPASSASTPPENTIGKKELAEILERSGAPGIEHRLLEPLVGKFECEMRLFVGGDPAGIVSRGVCTGRWIMGKRFVELSMLPAADEELKIESMQVLGFDTRSREHFCWGVDSTANHTAHARGSYDIVKRTFTLEGKNEESGQSAQAFRQVFRIDDDARITSQVWVKSDLAGSEGGWLKIAETEMVRRR